MSDFAPSWTVARQASLSMGFSRPELSHLGSIYIYIYPVGEESACNTGDLGLIPGLGRSPGGHGNHSSVLAWRIMDRDWQTTVHGVAESDVTEATEHVRARVCVCVHTHTHIHTYTQSQVADTLKEAMLGPALI